MSRSDRGRKPPQARRIAIAVAICVAAVLGIAVRQSRVRLREQAWTDAVRRLDLQTYRLSPLSEPNLSLAGAVWGMVVDGQLAVVVTNDDDSRRLLALHCECPTGTCIMVAPYVSDPQKMELGRRYRTARVTTFADFYGAAGGGGPRADVTDLKTEGISRQSPNNSEPERSSRL